MATIPSPVPSSPSRSPSPSDPDPNPNPSSGSNPNPIAASDEITPTIAIPPPGALRPPSSAATRRVPPPCWSVEETLALIDSYREKWYSLRRGNLRASQWQEVADEVSRRCQHLPAISAAKTAVQCRHKIEKLRKRYRSERQRALRLNPNPNAITPSSWVFFRKMEAMELGSDTCPGGNLPPRPPSPSSSSVDASLSDDDNGYDCVGNSKNRHSDGFHGLIPNGTGHKGESGTKLKFKIPKAIRSSKVGIPPTSYPNSNMGSSFIGDYTTMKPPPFGMEEMRRNVEKKKRKEREEHGGSGMGEIVAAVRMLGDAFMRMEQMKMDMTREIHNLRMEMELKHTEMILDTQRRIVDTFLTGLVGKKRTKFSPGV